MSNDNEFITWDDQDSSSRERAFNDYSDSIDSYAGLSKSQGSHYRTFIDVETNRSVRPGYRTTDYHAFRPDEQIPQKQKKIIKMCMDAYDKVGIIRNVIDLMGDFGSQGISLVHENKSAESFFKQWFKKIDGKERSERFLNNLYRCGNVVIYRSNATMTNELVKYMRAVGNDIKVSVPDIAKNIIPWRYNFFNPTTVQAKDGNLSLFLGKRHFNISTNSFFDNFKNGTIPSHILETLPPNIKNRIKRGDKEIPLDPDRLSVFYYKKDDWRQWANPMIYAILDDIVMLEKMRLADLSALDGAISNIRLWTLGDLEHKILPNKAAINKLRDILASNVGGGTMELVWGPELSYTESNSQVYKFLGSEKYTSVLNSIYAGLGVPPTLTGMAGNGGGFTNNFISLKTLVERLQYGRELLTKFWQKEIEIVRKAMGFRKPAQVHFDQMSLSDEAAEKNLLIQLADRDIISHETILERFKEMPSVEKIRLKREVKERDSGKSPDKASPYHNPQHDNDLEKIGLQSGKLNPADVGLETTVPDDILMPKPAPPSGPPQKEKKKSDPKGGRPIMKKDEGPRKKRTEKPKSKPGVAETLVWLETAWAEISSIVNTAFLGSKNKKNLRQLTKADVSDLEKLKLCVLTNTELFTDVDEKSVHKTITSGQKTPAEFRTTLTNKNINTTNLNIDDYRKHVLGSYLEFLLS
tara:strand:+ start:8514 stop:10598 length:2085 start_codon:yes stop_codon:yes gene_type:complete